MDNGGLSKSDQWPDRLAGTTNKRGKSMLNLEDIFCEALKGKTSCFTERIFNQN